MSALTWALLTACLWGVVPLLEKAGLARVTPMVGLFYRCLGVLCGLAALAFFLKPQQLKDVDGRSVFLLVLGGFIASFVAQMTFYRSLKLGQVSSVVPVSGSYPLIAFLLGVLIFGESMTMMKLCGVILIVAGIWVLNVG